MPQTKGVSDLGEQGWTLGTLSHENMFSVATSAGAIANTAIAAFYPLPTNTKLSKIVVCYTAATAVGGTFAFNIVYNSGAQLNGAQAYTQGNIPGNDNSSINGYPTNPAVPGQSLFSTDVLISNAAANAYSATTANGTAGCKVAGTGWVTVTTTGGVGIFVPDAYDAFYPLGGVLTLRLVVPAASTLSNFTVVGLPVTRPISPTNVTQTVSYSGTTNQTVPPSLSILPGSSF